MEPWDGPASIAFTDGKQIGAVLDRNGLRPSRYYVTKDDLVIMASEAGVLDIPPGEHRAEGPAAARPHVPGGHRAGPHHRRRGDQAQIASERPVPRSGSTSTWSTSTICPRPPELPAAGPRELLQRQVAFGYTFEDQRIVIVADGARRRRGRGLDGQRHAAGGAVGKPRLLYDYFKQLFAQVTNPPIDCIREEIVTSAETRLARRATC